MSFDNRQPTTRRELREQENRRTPARGRSVGPPSGAEPVETPVATRTIVVRQPAVKSWRKRAASSLLSFGAMTFAAALLVGVSVPANAFMSDAKVVESKFAVLEGQSVAVSADAASGNTTRAGFTVTSYAELLRARYGNRSYSYSVGRGPVQWPFPYAVPISDGFGERVAPCRGCSSFHTGTDFTPGAGTAIYAIAAGTVSFTEVSDYGFGNSVIIDHVIDGQRVQSMYGHMQMSSSPLQVGDVVNVGDFVGLVGETGVAIGAHLHLGIIIKGVDVDPYAWLKAHAAG